MEKRKDSLTTVKQCRFCLSDELVELQSLYYRNRQSRNSVTLPMKILSSVSMEVFPSDKMPTYICRRCSFFMDVCYEFKQVCRQADESIFKFIQSGSTLEPIVWPSLLSRTFKNGAKKPTSLKTTVEDGTKVEVTPQYMSESEEDTENVYNVKVEDGIDEESARIKVVTGINDTKKKSKPRNRGFSTAPKLTRHVRTHAGDRPYPCKYCNKSFLKSHHYTRHLRVKHQESGGGAERYRCDQCEDTFATQDELIYHSAIHATQNLTCPLCQEKFDDVDAVTAHIKSHVTEEEFMCDYCELVFTCKEKLDAHAIAAHEEEMHNSMEFEENESSMDMDAEPEAEYDDAAINIKEEGDELLLEIKKPEEFMLSNSRHEVDERGDNTYSEESEAEASYMDMGPADPLAVAKLAPMPQLTAAPTFAFIAAPPAPAVAPPSVAPPPITPTPVALVVPAHVAPPPVAPPPVAPPPVLTKPVYGQTLIKNAVSTKNALAVRKTEILKRRVIQQSPKESVQEQKVKPVSKIENSSNAGANDKSLRLLEKELQELKRTTSRNEIPKTPAKTAEPPRSNRRPQLHTSTPKPRPTEEKKYVSAKIVEKKVVEKRSARENKEAKESKDTRTKDESKAKPEEKEKDLKEPETPKNIIKNGDKDKSAADEGPVRRSTRPSKVKDYAKMVRDRPQEGSDYDDSDDDDEEYLEEEKNESQKSRRGSVRPAAAAKPTPAAAPARAAPTRKRGRPRKGLKDYTEVAPKMRKEENVEENKSEAQDETENVKSNEEDVRNPAKDPLPKENDENKASDDNGNAGADKTNEESPKKVDMLVSPTGATLKKVGTLPPGIKALPLPKTRAMGPGELCEMQIGKKVVKVQKIVMTKAEVEAMAKKGLLEMKDGTMVLKQGIKLPAKDPVAIRTSLVGEEAGKESPVKKYKSAPMRCDYEEET